MIAVTGNVDARGARSFLVDVKVKLEKRRDFNEALGIRLRRELRTHFTRRNSEPNKMDAPKTNFWNQVAAATDLGEITETGAEVRVAEARFRIHLFGGTIVPKVAKALTIPLIKEARGESVASYRRKTGHRLFTIPGRDVLFEKMDSGRATESRVNATRGRDRSFGVKLAPKQPLRGVFLLRDSVTIDKDPKALPPLDDLVAALQEEADDFMEYELSKGGLA